jgi:hypothetical protein
LSASAIGCLKDGWLDEHTAWRKRDLSAKRYVYIWADGIHLQARLEDEKQCILVLIGATPEDRLCRSKFDSIDINAEVFVQARASFEMFDRLTHLAQSRRIGLLREISLRRELRGAPGASLVTAGRSGGGGYG